MMKIAEKSYIEIIIPIEKKLQRIDNFLISKFKNISKSIIYRLIRKGIFRINKKRVKPRYKLQVGNKIRIPKSFFKKEKKKTLSYPIKYKDFLLKNILYEDKYIIAINKPHNMAVHGGSGLSFGIIEILRILKPKEHFLELVHRLDRDTSGVLLIAKNRFVLRSLHQQFIEKKIKKQYLGLVRGIWPYNLKKISSPLLKRILKNGKKIVCVNKLGKNAETRFKIKKQYQNATLIKIFPITGRTHQIRVHTSHHGYPIAFDKYYGDSFFNNALKQFNINRLFLHANKISFIHPKTEKFLEITSPLDYILKKFLKKFENTVLKT